MSEKNCAVIDPRITTAFNTAHGFALEKTCIMLCYVGSKSHNTYIPNTDPDAIDDVDIFGVVIPPPQYTLGLETFEHWVFKQDELDVVLYSLHKFIGLLIKANPNVLGTLWTRPEHLICTSPEWAMVQEQRTLFTTKAAFDSFAGYADGQLKKMTSFAPEIQLEMDTLEAELEAAGWHLQDVMDKRSVPMPKGLTPADANQKADRLRGLRAKFHAAYMGEKRRRLVMKHGYDTKNAAHLIRLLRMCIEFLGDGTMRVWRTDDADEIRAIKSGAWTVEQVKDHATVLFAKARAAKEASMLPGGVDFPKVSALAVAVARQAYGW